MTARARVGIVQGSMLWLRRSFILAPVAAFLAAALLLSCGGGGGSSSQGSGLPLSLMSLSVCNGTPPSPTPTPSKTSTKGPTPTPIKRIAQCTPAEVETPALLLAVDHGAAQPSPSLFPTAALTPATNSIVNFNAQGTLMQSNNGKGRKIYFDFTNNGSLSWNIETPVGAVTPAAIFGSPGVLVTGGGPGCVCIDASVQFIESCPVLVAVGGAACTPCPTPSPNASPSPFNVCPGRVPTPTPTHTPKQKTPTPTATPTCGLC